MKYLDRLYVALYCLVQCTWGLLQTVLGFLLFLRHIRGPHRIYRGAVVTGWPGRGGISLGLYVFVPDSLWREDGDAKRDTRILMHEYGHTIQSLILGPLYLLTIGLPSFLWCNLPAMRRRRKEQGISYYAFYTERWADALGLGEERT